jgi:hypothetical protein
LPVTGIHDGEHVRADQRRIAGGVSDRGFECRVEIHREGFLVVAQVDLEIVGALENRLSPNVAPLQDACAASAPPAGSNAKASRPSAAPMVLTAVILASDV